MAIGRTWLKKYMSNCTTCKQLYMDHKYSPYTECLKCRKQNNGRR